MTHNDRHSTTVYVTIIGQIRIVDDDKHSLTVTDKIQILDDEKHLITVTNRNRTLDGDTCCI